jgi:serine/threonine protein kinase
LFNFLLGPTSPQTQQVKINRKFVPYTLNSVTFLGPVRNVGARNKIWHIKYKGEKLFAKVGDMWNEKKIVKELLHESSIYSILQKFQGEVIPYLKYSGPVYGVYVLATSICGKSLKHFHLNSSDLSEIKDKAWTGLKKIHSLNVLHGDIRLENIIWNSQTRRVYWIDFGFSRQNFEWKELIEEENNFNVLFDELIHNEILH